MMYVWRDRYVEVEAGARSVSLGRALRWLSPSDGTDEMAEILSGLNSDGLLSLAASAGEDRVCELAPPLAAGRWVIDTRIPNAQDKWRAWRPGEGAVTYGERDEFIAALELLLRLYLRRFDDAAMVPQQVQIGRLSHVKLLLAEDQFVEQMPRTPEPELMDDEAQALAYAKADFSAEDAAFMARLEATFELEGTVVDLGCGPGNITLRVAATTECEVVGLDGAEAMLKFARERAGERVRFQCAFIPSDDLPQADAIVSNSLLHHLHDPQGLWKTVKQIGRPGAPVFIGDLRRPATVEMAEKLLATYADDEPEILRRDFLASLHAAFTVPEIEAQLEEAGLDLNVEATDDRHLFVWGRLPE